MSKIFFFSSLLLFYLEVQVLETGEFYGPGQFIANLVFQGVYHDDIANFTGTVKICENRAKLNNTHCMRMLFDFDEFDWSPDCKV